MMLTPEEVYRLKQPCKNMGAELRVLLTDNVTINGILFDNAKDAEEYLMTLERSTGMSNRNYYRNTGKVFQAKKPGYCNLCLKEFKKGDMIAVTYWTESKTPVHAKCRIEHK